MGTEIEEHATPEQTKQQEKQQDDEENNEKGPAQTPNLPDVDMKDEGNEDFHKKEETILEEDVMCMEDENVDNEDSDYFVLLSKKPPQSPEPKLYTAPAEAIKYDPEGWLSSSKQQ